MVYVVNIKSRNSLRGVHHEWSCGADEADPRNKRKKKMTLANTEMNQQKIRHETMTNPDGSEFTVMILRDHEGVFGLDRSGREELSYISIFHVDDDSDDDSEYGCEDANVTIYNDIRYGQDEATVEISYSRSGSNTQTIEDAEKRISAMQFAVALAKLL